MKCPKFSKIVIIIIGGTSITTGLYQGADQISGAAGRLSFDTPVTGDVQDIMIMTNFE